MNGILMKIAPWVGSWAVMMSVFSIDGAPARDTAMATTVGFAGNTVEIVPSRSCSDFKELLPLSNMHGKPQYQAQKGAALSIIFLLLLYKQNHSAVRFRGKWKRRDTPPLLLSTCAFSFLPFFLFADENHAELLCGAM